MANLVFLTSLVLSFVLLPRLSLAISSCNGPCQTLDDCDGELICINSRCNDDPDVGSHHCSGGGGSSPSPSGSCQSTSNLNCNGQSYPQYQCSPIVSSSTQATLTNNDFSEGGDGGDPSKCDESFHDNSELIVALSTGWYNRGSRCGKMIRIKATNGRSVLAKVVDECDSMNGCDKEHAFQPPCRNNIVDGSNAVWSALGLNTNVGEEAITWSDA